MCPKYRYYIASIVTRISAFMFSSVYLKNQLLFGHLLANVATGYINAEYVWMVHG